MVSSTTTEKALSAVLFAQCLEKFNPILIKGVPREQYIEHTVITSTADITLAHKWLIGYVATLKAYNAYAEKCSHLESIERPDDSYIGDYGVELSDPLVTNLDLYMRKAGNAYTHSTLLQILDLIKEASAELLKIKDEIEYDYFVRRAKYVVDDIWAVLTTLILVNKHYDK